MTIYIIVSVVCLLVGFIVGALVFRNNPVKGEAIVDKAEKVIEEVKDKV